MNKKNWEERFDELDYVDRDGAVLGIREYIIKDFIRAERKKVAEEMLEAVTPEIRDKPNPLKIDIVHNAGEKQMMLINCGWNACRQQVLANIEELLKSL